MTEKDIDIIIKKAKEYEINSVYLFGSQARGDASSSSDIDIIVDTEGSKATTLFSLGALYEDLKASLDKEVDIMTLEALKEYMNDGASCIIANNIRKDMVKIY